MTEPVKAIEPERRMGVYKSLSEVPVRYRLDNFTAEYRGEDTWTEYIQAEDERRDLSDWYLERADIAGRSWKSHMHDLDRHHALAKPEDVDTWCRELLDERKLRTVYERYWTELESFYAWLQAHAEHHHVYQPVLMAAANYDAASMVWEEKIENGRKRAEKLAQGERK
ncbi:hypothetical protein ACFQE8_20960 [Salinirubellus sp. GCM10025818]|uniref:hypothetical protein n=1 Tax=Salinirubellus TaxID=2162630 RepID=UPI0030D15A9A